MGAVAALSALPIFSLKLQHLNNDAFHLISSSKLLISSCVCKSPQVSFVRITTDYSTYPCFGFLKIPWMLKAIKLTCFPPSDSLGMALWWPDVIPNHKRP